MDGLISYKVWDIIDITHQTFHTLCLCGCYDVVVFQELPYLCKEGRVPRKLWVTQTIKQS